MPPTLPQVRREALATARLAGPLVGGQLAHTGLGFLDTVMAGKLSAEVLAGVAVGTASWIAAELFVFGALMAVPPSVSQLDGAGRRGEIPAFLRQAFWVAVGLAALSVLVAWNYRPVLAWIQVQPELIPTVEGYLRAIAWGMPGLTGFLLLRFLCEGLGDTRPVLLFGLLGLPVNAVGNYLFMYGKLGLPALGAVGCGHATSLVWWVQCLGLALYVARSRRYRSLALFSRLEAPRGREIAEILHLGVPIGAAIFMEAGLFASAALLISTLGTAVVAGHQVALNIAAVSFMVPLGISMAITVRLGNAAGRGDRPGALFSVQVGLAMVLACQGIAASLMLLAPGILAGFYTDQPEVAAVAVQLLFFAALFQLSDGLQAAGAGALRGLKDTRAILAITLVAYWLVGFPTGYALAFPAGLGARGMWIGLIAGLTAAALGLLLRLKVALGRVGRAGGEG